MTKGATTRLKNLRSKKKAGLVLSRIEQKILARLEGAEKEKSN
jgi:hypothetical protein